MIKACVLQNGFEGILFPVNGRKDKVVIVISGSNGGMKLTKVEAEFYAKNGIPALAVAIFATRGTKPNLDRIPLEYIEAAICFLKRQGYERIAIDGTSKGSELALLSASQFDSLSCVIARVPSHFVSEGLVSVGKSKKPSGTSCWSYHGKQVPFAPYNMRSFNIIKMFLREREMHIIDFNTEKTVRLECIIPIEKIKGPVLFLSSKNDTVWPSYKSSLLMMDKLKEVGFVYPYKHIAYKYMSHVVMTQISWLYVLAFKNERRYKLECSKEREELKKGITSLDRKSLVNQSQYQMPFFS